MWVRVRPVRWGWTLLVLWLFGPAMAQTAPTPDSPRIALVVGLGDYRASPLPAAANDAGLVAQTLAAAGFDVTGARDLDGDHLRQAFKDFIAKAAAGGPRGIALVYVAAHAVQYEGDNYIVPVDATLSREADIPIESTRLTDLTHALAGTNLGIKVVVVDGAHADEASPKLFASGLALSDPDPGLLLAFNAAPGSVAPIDKGPYGAYAAALVRVMKQGGVPVEEVFARLRVMVNTDTRGAVVPWSASKLVAGFTFFDRAADAPAIDSAQIPFASLRSRPLREFTADQAYDIAIARDSLPAYEDYLTAFPVDPLARRIKRLLAGRREALFWRDVLRANAPPAFWTYLQRYPRGPHVAEAQRRLSRVTAGLAPPPGFTPMAFDVPPPPDDELPIVEQRSGLIDADLPPPPPPPVFLLPPPPPGEAPLPPPGLAAAAGFLPIPIALAIPFVRPILAPGFIRPPRQFKGAYRQPRPFGASPDNGGLVPQPADERPIRGTIVPAGPGVSPGPGPQPPRPLAGKPLPGASNPPPPNQDDGSRLGGLRPGRLPAAAGSADPGQGLVRPDPRALPQPGRLRPDGTPVRPPGHQSAPALQTAPIVPALRPPPGLTGRPIDPGGSGIVSRPRLEPRPRLPDPLPRPVVRPDPPVLRPAPVFRQDPPAFRQQPPVFRQPPPMPGGQPVGVLPRSGLAQGGFGGGGAGGGVAVRPSPMMNNRQTCLPGQMNCR